MKKLISMKRNAFIMAVVALFSLCFTGCDILDWIDINFTTDAQSIEFTIQPANAGAHFEQFELITSDLKKQIEDNGGEIEDLKTVKISEISIEVISGAVNLNAFESFEVTMESEGIAPKKIAWADNVPADVIEVIPGYSVDNLKDFISQTNYTITLLGVMRAQTTAEVVLKVTVYYDVVL